MPEQEGEQPEKCRRCHSPLFGAYCSNCGQPRELRRINGRYILSEIGSVLNFEKGILFTIRELLVRPGINIQRFIHEDRERLVKPLVFIIVCSLVYTLLQQWLGFEDGYVGYSFEGESTANALFDWLSKNYGYTNILLSVFMAIWIKIFFRKQENNFFEILIMLCFIMGTGMLIFSFFGIMDSLTNLKIIDKGFSLGVLYISWGVGRFFGKKKVVNYLKSLLSYLLGLISFTFVVLLCSFLIDYLRT